MAEVVVEVLAEVAVIVCRGLLLQRGNELLSVRSQGALGTVEVLSQGFLHLLPSQGSAVQLRKRAVAVQLKLALLPIELNWLPNEMGATTVRALEQGAEVLKEIVLSLQKLMGVAPVLEMTEVQSMMKMIIIISPQETASHLRFGSSVEVQ